MGPAMKIERKNCRVIRNVIPKNPTIYQLDTKIFVHAKYRACARHSDLKASSKTE
jgi:hypothetical protein